MKLLWPKGQIDQSNPAWIYYGASATIDGSGRVTSPPVSSSTTSATPNEGVTTLINTIAGPINIVDDAIIGAVVPITLGLSAANGKTITSVAEITDADSKFTVAANGVITLSAVVDFGTKTSHSLTVRATLSDASTVDATFSINVQAADTAPVVAGGQSFAFNEGVSNGTVIGTLSASDAETDPLENWAIVGGTAAAKVGLNAGSGQLVISNGAAFDFETLAAETLIVTVDANGLTSAQQTINFTINNVDDNVPVFTSPAAVTVAPGGTAILTLVATDADGTTPTYSKSGGADEALFSVTGSALAFVAAGQLGVYVVQVRASGPTLFADQTITVNVQAIADSSFDATTQSEINAAIDGPAELAVVQAAIGVSPSWEALDAAGNVMMTGPASTVDYGSGFMELQSLHGPVTHVAGAGANGTPMTDIRLTNGARTARWDNNFSTLVWSADYNATITGIAPIGTYIA